MLAFRPALLAEDTQPLSPDAVPRICDEVIDPANFLVSPACRLHWSRRREEPFWELFLGQALGRSQTRERRPFDSWWVSIDGGDSDEPLLALRWDRAAERIHVTRSIECRMREGYESQPGVFDSRTVTRWARELVGTIELNACRTVGRLRDELQGLLFQAVVGTSRLPLTSLESPLPAFTLGQLMYSFRAQSSSFRARAHSSPALPHFERSKALEFSLRSDGEVADIAHQLLQSCEIDECLALLFSVFNGASLSPYTEFVPRSMALLRRLTDADLPKRADFIASLVLLLDRHLCAYDLVKFHHRGANYPDALLLDELWRELLELDPSMFTFRADSRASQRRRRSLRHLLLLRLEYAGHPVPDWPTSIGENARVMPTPFHELPEEQIHAPTRRKRKLFDSEIPSTNLVWSTLDDLADPREVRELGTALFLNRPLGIAKHPSEPDRTPLLSHRLVSRTIAERRLQLASRRACLGGIELIDGLALTDCGPPPRPGVVSLHDAMLTADDWIALRTTRSSLRDWDAAFDWSESGMQPSRDWRIVLPDGDDLVAYDEQLKPLARIAVDFSAGYRLSGGIEVPAAGLVVSASSSSNKSRVPAAIGD